MIVCWTLSYVLFCLPPAIQCGDQRADTCIIHVAWLFNLEYQTTMRANWPRERQLPPGSWVGDDSYTWKFSFFHVARGKVQLQCWIFLRDIQRLWYQLPCWCAIECSSSFTSCFAPVIDTSCQCCAAHRHPSLSLSLSLFLIHFPITDSHRSTYSLSGSGGCTEK